MIRLDSRTLLQFVRYAIVGVINTLITLIVIYVAKSLIGINEYLSNAIGYIAGLVNSFIWNKNWVFRVKEESFLQVVRFLVGFAVCYLLQITAVWALTEHTVYGPMVWDIYGFKISGYGVATLIGMVLYTLANFVYNRLVTFRV